MKQFARQESFNQNDRRDSNLINFDYSKAINELKTTIDFDQDIPEVERL